MIVQVHDIHNCETLEQFSFLLPVKLEKAHKFRNSWFWWEFSRRVLWYQDLNSEELLIIPPFGFCSSTLNFTFWMFWFFAVVYSFSHNVIDLCWCRKKLPSSHLIHLQSSVLTFMAMGFTTRLSRWISRGKQRETIIYTWPSINSPSDSAKRNCQQSWNGNKMTYFSSQTGAETCSYIPHIVKYRAPDCKM